MRFLSSLFALVVVVGACLIHGQDIDFRPIKTSPAFIWSNTNYLFSGQNVQVLDIVSSSDITNSILRNKINTVLSHHFNGGNAQQKPEVFFLFVEDQLRSDQVSVLAESLENVKSSVQSAASSMVIPYVYNTEDSKIGNDIAVAISEAANKVVTATNGDSANLPVSLRRNVISLEKLMSLSSDNSWELLNNNQMDLVVIFFDRRVNNNLPDVAGDDAFIGTLLANINKKEASYVALFTAQQPSAQVQYFFPSSDPKLVRFEQSIQQIEEVDNSCKDCLWPNDVIEGLVVIAPFLIILLIGVTCNFQIQSELKYDAERPRRF